MTRVALVAHWDWVLFNFRLPIARRLRESGFDVTLMCPRGQFVDQICQEGFRYVEWKVDRRSLNPLRERHSLSGLASIYADLAPDVVHHFTIKPNLYGTVAAKRVGVPVIINTFSGMGFFMSGGAVATALRIGLTPIMGRLFRAPHVWTIFQNSDDLDLAVSRRLVSRNRTRLIAGSGVDIDRFKPGGSPPREGPPVVFMAARLIKQKGVADFVTAAQSLKDKGLSARFVVAGAQDRGNPSAITDQEMDKWRRGGAVEFVGHVSEIETWLARSAVAVLPTYYPEGLPRFLLEAAATGLPLVATDIAPCRPIVKEGYNGYLVPTRDPEYLAMTIARLIRDEPLRVRMGNNSRELVVRRFRESEVVDEYMRLYYDALGVGH